ncbi:MAG: hypothetical protein Q4D98_09980 [Planctomycetia bacterium]|nr:hypothetical protein [Planctomycetia bacterium]
MNKTKMKTILQKFPASYEEPYKSKPEEFFWGEKEWYKTYVNGTCLADLAELYRCGYLNIKYRFSVVREGLSSPEFEIEEFPDTIGFSVKNKPGYKPEPCTYEMEYDGFFNRIYWITSDHDLQAGEKVEVVLEVSRTGHGDWFISSPSELTDERARELLGSLPAYFEETLPECTLPEELCEELQDFKRLERSPNGGRYNAGTYESDELKRRLSDGEFEIIVDDTTYGFLNFGGFWFLASDDEDEAMELYRRGYVEVGEVVSIDYVGDSATQSQDDSGLYPSGPLLASIPEDVNIVAVSRRKDRWVGCCFWYGTEEEYAKILTRIHYHEIHTRKERWDVTFSSLKMFRLTPAGMAFREAASAPGQERKATKRTDGKPPLFKDLPETVKKDVLYLLRRELERREAEGVTMTDREIIDYVNETGKCRVGKNALSGETEFAREVGKLRRHTSVWADSVGYEVLENIAKDGELF